MIWTYSKNELKDIFKGLPSDVRLFAQVMLETGLRPSEVRGLTRQSLRKDEQGFYIMVFQAYTERGLSKGKSKSAQRVIPISQELFEQLWNASSEGFIFKRTLRYYRKVWHNTAQRVLPQAPPEKWKLYTLRKTALTNFVQKGVNPYELAYLAGHSSLNVALQYYIATPLMQKLQAKEVER